ncbi:small acid-soluble spore protein Tlp [Pseudalkalibacillus caeni]|uniref:Small acid-soluble spore protein Tlp n=1 Tax=Exobacillus caeni TaxID=2574798 RepID=A0A5R9FCS1_9BACL|nr:small acid-soluble spore protein Tlp [Pseudalkalibacillus caeni]TLS37445.1 small acid-soluble spore protein Tlp [Pseudalkalibacillus caeni]
MPVPKPDDRRDNKEKLQEMVQNTIENIHESENSLPLTDSKEQQHMIQEKNKRREQSIDAMRSEIKDETNVSK